MARSLAPSTLANYFRCVQVAERHVGTSFVTWLPFSEVFIQGYVASMMQAEVSASTINLHMAAFGTFAAFVNCPRPRTAMVAYLLKGLGKSGGLPPKTRVHSFPFRATVDCINTMTNLAVGKE